MNMTIMLKVNGREISLRVKPNELLLDVLRERLHLTGAKYGCGIGECGACTVLVNGQAILACQTLAVTVAGQEIRTIEGLAAENGELDPLQEAFVEEGAVQCGYCTPGMILAAKALIDEQPDPGTAEIQDALRGNLCRCTGYSHIIRAVKKGAEKMRSRSKE